MLIIINRLEDIFGSDSQWQFRQTRKPRNNRLRLPYGTESGRDLRRDIEVSDAQVDEVCKGIQSFKSPGSILDHANNAIEPFGGGVGQVRIDEGGDTGRMLSQRIDQPAQGLQAAAQGPRSSTP